MVSTLGLAGFAFLIAQQVTAAAPAQRQNVTVTASVGRGSTWDDEGGIGAGLSAGGSVEWRLHPRLSAVLRVEQLAHERHMVQDLRMISGRTIFATGEVRYRFGSGRVVPFAVGGYGAALHSGTLIDRVGPPLTLQRSSRSGVGVGGAGMEVSISDRLSVMPEVRLLMCQPNDDSEPWAAIRGGVSVGWRF
jgi:hypothetical protein